MSRNANRADELYRRHRDGECDEQYPEKRNKPPISQVPTRTNNFHADRDEFTFYDPKSPRLRQSENFQDYVSNNLCKMSLGSRAKPLPKRYSFEKGDGPPPDPVYNFLADPERDPVRPERVRRPPARDRDRASRGRPGDAGSRGSNRGNHSHGGGGGGGGAGDRPTRVDYDSWRAERDRIDQERINRQKTSDGHWRREWDNQKIAQELSEGRPVSQDVEERGPSRTKNVVSPRQRDRDGRVALLDYVHNADLSGGGETAEEEPVVRQNRGQLRGRRRIAPSTAPSVQVATNSGRKSENVERKVQSLGNSIQICVSMDTPPISAQRYKDVTSPISGQRYRDDDSPTSTQRYRDADSPISARRYRDDTPPTQRYRNNDSPTSAQRYRDDESPTFAQRYRDDDSPTSVQRYRNDNSSISVQRYKDDNSPTSAQRYRNDNSPTSAQRYRDDAPTMSARFKDDTPPASVQRVKVSPRNVIGSGRLGPRQKARLSYSSQSEDEQSSRPVHSQPRGRVTRPREGERFRHTAEVSQRPESAPGKPPLPPKEGPSLRRPKEQRSRKRSGRRPTRSTGSESSEVESKTLEENHTSDGGGGDDSWEDVTTTSGNDSVCELSEDATTPTKKRPGILKNAGGRAVTHNTQRNAETASITEIIDISSEDNDNSLNINPDKVTVLKHSASMPQDNNVITESVVTPPNVSPKPKEHDSSICATGGGDESQGNSSTTNISSMGSTDKGNSSTGNESTEENEPVNKDGGEEQHRLLKVSSNGQEEDEVNVTSLQDELLQSEASKTSV